MIRAFAMTGRTAAAVIAILACPLPSNGQIPGIPNLNGKNNAEATAGTPQNDGDRLLAWQSEAQAQIARMDELAGNGVPNGIATIEVAARRSELEQIVGSAERQLRSLKQKEEAKTARDALRKQAEAWNGFPSKQTFPVMLVDDLRNQREAAKRKIATHESMLNLLDRSLGEIQPAILEAEEEHRRALDAAAKNTDPAAKWRADSAQFKVRAVVLRQGSLQASVEVQKLQLDAARTEVAWLDKKLEEAAPQQTFSEADLIQIRKAAVDRQNVLSSESDAMRKRLVAASAALKKAQAAAQLASEPADREFSALKLEAAQTQADSYEFIANLLDNARQIESLMVDAYMQRRAIISATSATDRITAVAQLEKSLERLAPWDKIATNELALVSAELDRNGSRSGALPAGDPKLGPLQSQREALWEKSEAIRRISQNVSFQQQNITTWLSETRNAERQRPWSERASANLATAWQKIKRIWTYEVFTYEDASSASGKRGVALGVMIGALLFFIIGYRVAWWSSEKVQNWMVSHKRIAGAQANTIRRWLMTMVAFLLVITTLKFLSIPLTVFAFFGGALAIGLGFGTQTLIKNFISGIIILFERKVRVGDILSVDNVVGTVTEINTRSSIIRSGDGLETLIPNSVFLESKVTNWTHSNRRVRATIRLNIAYGSDPARTAELLLDCAQRHGLVLKDPAPSVAFEDFGAEAMLFALHIWVELNDKSNTGLVTSDLRYIIEKRLAEIGVSLPNKEMRLITTSPIGVELAVEKPAE